jgi:hypothetical protein
VNAFVFPFRGKTQKPKSAASLSLASLTHDKPQAGLTESARQVA